MKKMVSLASGPCVCAMVAILALTFLSAFPVFAQAPAKAKGAPPAAPAEMAPPVELGQLSFFDGEWSCKGKAEASPMGPAHPTEATVRINRDLGGYWFVGHYAEKKSAANPHPMVFHFVQGYDATAKSFTMDCYDAFGGHCHQTATGWKDGKIVYSGQGLGNGPPTPVRDTFTKTGEASLEHAGEIQMDGKWVAIDHETCTKGKK
ncbi:MAG TPA: hypothetical protein VF173_26490 [Thermoanaerobaculia bacterium]|nr:hypothetical protein [Thermoanaerobaculia bacterium]